MVKKKIISKIKKNQNKVESKNKKKKSEDKNEKRYQMVL